MNEANVNAIRAGLLYMAARYHQIDYRAQMFDDGAISDIAVTAERNANRLANTIAAEGITSAEDAQVVNTALAAVIDSMNAELQKLHTHGQINDALLVEGRIRECYEAQTAVALATRGLAVVEQARAA